MENLRRISRLKGTRLFMVVGSFVCVAILSFYGLNRTRQESGTKDKPSCSNEIDTHLTHPLVAGQHPVRPVDGDRAKVLPPRTHTVTSLLSRWRRAGSELTGASLRTAQYAIAQQALQSLRGLEMAEFIEGLKADQGSDVFQWVIANGSPMLAACPEPEPAVEWVLNLQDSNLQEQVLYQLGRTYSQLDPESFMRRVSSPKAAVKFLSGHCVYLAGLDPSGAVATYVRLLPAGQDYSGLKNVMDALPEKTDFADVARSIPSDEKSIAREVRSTLISTWAKANPGEAAAYILNNPDVVSPDQIGVLVSQWIRNSPQGASEWASSLETGRHQDEAYKTIATHFIDLDPERAWSFALRTSNPTIRDQLLKQIHGAWLKRDPGAAEAAKTSYTGGATAP